MSTRQSYESKYKANADTVLSSKARVAAAGRWGDQKKIEEERERHRNLMKSLP